MYIFILIRKMQNYNIRPHMKLTLLKHEFSWDSNMFHIEIPGIEDPAIEVTQHSLYELATLYDRGVYFLSFVFVIPRAHLPSFKFITSVHKVPRLC
jgi:hypothetical protein